MGVVDVTDIKDTARRVISGYYPNGGPLTPFGEDAFALAEHVLAEPARDSLPDLAARVAALEQKFDAHTHHIESNAMTGLPLQPLPTQPPVLTFTTSRKPLTLVVGGQYRTRGGWRCVVVDEAASGLIVWHSDDWSTLKHYSKTGAYSDAIHEVTDHDIIGPWECGE